eukprot:scaffold120986_cov33-Tisochrysis_lutea.AAC.1
MARSHRKALEDLIAKHADASNQVLLQNSAARRLQAVERGRALRAMLPPPKAKSAPEPSATAPSSGSLQAQMDQILANTNVGASSGTALPRRRSRTLLRVEFEDAVDEEKIATEARPKLAAKDQLEVEMKKILAQTHDVTSKRGASRVRRSSRNLAEADCVPARAEAMAALAAHTAAPSGSLDAQMDVILTQAHSSALLRGGSRARRRSRNLSATDFAEARAEEAQKAHAFSAPASEPKLAMDGAELEVEVDPPLLAPKEASGIGKGGRARFMDLLSRPDLNGMEGVVLQWNTKTELWAVQCDASREIVQVKEENLVALTPPMGAVTVLTKSPADVEEVEEEEDSGVWVNARLGDKVVHIDPAELKRQFQEIVEKHGFNRGNKADAVADMLTNGEASTVRPQSPRELDYVMESSQLA